MKSRFLKLSLANFGYNYSKKGSKSFGSALIYVGASFLLLAIILAVLNFTHASVDNKTAESREKIITAGDYLS
jgi:hypothetical protein